MLIHHNSAYLENSSMYAEEDNYENFHCSVVYNGKKKKNKNAILFISRKMDSYSVV